MTSNLPPTLRDLFPDLNEGDLSLAEQHLERYLIVVLRIFERVELGPQVDPLTGGAGTLSCNPPPFEAS
jgi:hypothetical protein